VGETIMLVLGFFFFLAGAWCYLRAEGLYHFARSVLSEEEAIRSMRGGLSVRALEAVHKLRQRENGGGGVVENPVDGFLGVRDAH
jgi:hypothetical protein